MNSKVTEWMLEGPKWLQFAVERQLQGNDSSATNALEDRSIQELLSVIRSRDKGFGALAEGKVSYTGELFWYLFFLADVGFDVNDLGLEREFKQAMELENSSHRFLLSKEMKPDYFCISSILLATMARMSAEVRERLGLHLETIMDAQRLDGGWHCAKSRAAGQRGEKTESCLMDNLNILMLLALYDEYWQQSRLHGAIDLFLEHWRRRDEPWRPYGFGIGSEFKKLRYPAFKYGILRVLDVLSNYPYALEQPEFNEMLEFVQSKGVNGEYRAESVSRMFSLFDFGQRKEPSRWLTFLVARTEERAKRQRRSGVPTG